MPRFQSRCQNWGLAVARPPATLHPLYNLRRHHLIPRLAAIRRRALKRKLLAIEVDFDRAAFGVFALEELGGEWVLQLLLDHALERPCAELRVVAAVGDFLAGSFSHDQVQLAFLE